jgi:hypothetical protein
MTVLPWEVVNYRGKKFYNIGPRNLHSELNT